MSYETYRAKLCDLEHLLKSRPGMRVSDMAGRLEISPRSVHRMIDDLRLQGKKISYSRQHRRYFFD